MRITLIALFAIAAGGLLGASYDQVGD